jgi:hypothetical protein
MIDDLSNILDKMNRVTLLKVDYRNGRAFVLCEDGGTMNKSEEITRRQFSDCGQSWFSKKYACWANNHNGWSKMKQFNRRLFKKRYRREVRAYMLEELDSFDRRCSYEG